MSYLSFPRLHFSGKYQADPSTVNNYAGNFDADTFQADYSQLKGDWGDSWNPNGTGSWRFEDCVVTMVVYEDGTSESDPDKDPVIGLPLINTNLRVAGKIVDLDTQQQMVSEIWGFQLSLGGPAGSFTGNFHATAFADVWIRKPGPPTNANFAAFYQSTLELINWKENGNSRFLRELSGRYEDNAPDQLSIKFNVDGHNSDNTTDDFTFGRVTGTIGAHRKEDPLHFVPGRVMVPSEGSKVNNAYAIVESSYLHIDLGNSLPTSTPGGPLADIGILSIGLKGAEVVPLANIMYADPAWYSRNAGIVSIKLNAINMKSISNTPIQITATAVDGKVTTLLLEDPSGDFLRVDQFVFRMNPGDTAAAKIYYYKFGMPQAAAIISLVRDTSFMTGPPLSFELGTPLEALKFPSKITTGEAGMAVLEFSTGDPGNPRRYIDGQLYGLGYSLGTEAPQPSSTFYPINILLFSGYEIPEEPNWLEHVQPILGQYAILYPVMKPIVDLNNYSSVLQKRYILHNVFNLPIENPNYMPVTRDLSEGKRAMIKKWLRNPVYMNLDSVDDIKQALQLAIELEHSTIPPYLTALYSIKPGLNTEVAGLIRSIVLEEMLHMALMCNLLISVGGSPLIGRRSFVPTYPTSLPGGLRMGLTVRLRRCSIEHLRECFMAIEEPEEIISIKRTDLISESLSDTRKYTIGWFYDEILAALTRLSSDESIKFSNVDKQVCEWSGTGTLFAIKSLEDAERAIMEIKDQGEGTSKDPNDNDKELAHYYKFAEIVEGRHLVKIGESYRFTGAPIAFEKDAVWPMVDDPTASIYPKGSRAQILNHQFNETYRALLGALHKTFNGEPTYIRDAIGVMFSMETIALQLMKTPSGLNDGTTAGPSFEI